MLETLLDGAHPVEDPFIKPGHLEVSHSIEESLKNLESSCSQLDVPEAHPFHEVCGCYGLVHDQGCHCDSEEKGKGELVEEVDEDDYDVEAFEDEVEIAFVVVVKVYYQFGRCFYPKVHAVAIMA